MITAVQLASAMVNYNSSIISVLNINSNLNKLKNELKAEKSSHKIELNELKSNVLNVKSALTDVYREMDKIGASGTEAIYSPISGTIGYLPLHNGQTATADELVATIVPHKSKLVAKVILPSSAMGKVEVGDKVKIRYSSFPYLQYGLFDGVISSIATTPSQNQLGNAGGERQGYSTTIELSENRKLHLLPGAKLQATIITGHASFMRMIFAPVLGLKSAIGS